MLWAALCATVTSHNTVTSLDTVERVDRVVRAASGEELLLISLTTPPVFGFATNKKLISLQSQQKLMRSRAQLDELREYLSNGSKYFETNVLYLTLM